MVSTNERDATTAPTPLIQITREEMDQSGEANVVDYLADIPALTFSTVPVHGVRGTPALGTPAGALETLGFGVAPADAGRDTRTDGDAGADGVAGPLRGRHQATAAAPTTRTRMIQAARVRRFSTCSRAAS